MPGKLRFPGLLVYYLAFLLLLYLPIGLLFLFSINDGRQLIFPIRGLTTRWYALMLENPQLLTALRNSALVALASSSAATLLGSAAAIALVRFDIRGKVVFIAVALAPLLVPFLILGVSLLILFDALSFRQSLLTIMAAHTVIGIPYTLLIIMARLAGFDSRLEEAARDLGATYSVVLTRIILPLIAPAMLAAFLVAFTVSFDELVLASWLNGGNNTLPIFIYSSRGFPDRFPQTVALAVAVMFVSLALVLIAERLQRIGAQTGRGTQAAPQQE